MLKDIYEEIRNDSKPRPADYIEGDKERKIANITFELANCHYHKKEYEKAIELYIE